MTQNTPPGDRIAKVIARAGLASRREAEQLILQGRVSVNGKTISSPALNVTASDKVVVNGKVVGTPDEPRLWLYHKPVGLVTTTKDEQGRPTIFDKLPEEMPRVMSVGRLDLNSEGLLLLTNDGGIKRKLELPSTGWLRKYRVRVKGQPKDESLEPLRKGMVIDLNSCVRPYLVDSIKKILVREGARHALVELEQDIATIGKQPDGANWLVGVRFPTGGSARIHRFKLNEGNFALRGDFERTLRVNGERYSQALSPVDGQPIPGLLAVAVTSESCRFASSAAGLAMMKAEPAALNWLDSLGLPWAAIDRNLSCHGPLAPKVKAA